MAKYGLLHARVCAMGVEAAVPCAARDEALERVHTAGYVRRVARGELLPAEIRRIGFPWSPQLVERSRRSVGATIDACRAALRTGVGVNLAGGTHHALPDRGEGFCVFNDAAVAVRSLQAAGAVNRAVIIDCDVHQGNGTATMFHDDPAILTIDLYGADNFPFEKHPARVDRPLPDGTDDRRYLAVLDGALDVLEGEGPFDLAVYVSGADPFGEDRLGRLALTKAGLAERDRRVLACCARLGLPVAVVMGGGYARAVEDTVDIHAATVEVALRAATRRGVA